MMNIYFPDEKIEKNDVYFICYMIERVARTLHQRNRYVVNRIGKKNLEHLISVANVLHAENPLAVEDAWIEDYSLERGNVDVADVDRGISDQNSKCNTDGKGVSKINCRYSDAGRKRSGWNYQSV